MSYQTTSASRPYPDGANASVPKEIGLLQRAEGIASGLASIENGLNDLMNRLLQGSVPPETNTKVAGFPCGMPAVFEKAEEHIRSCHQQLSKINGIL